MPVQCLSRAQLLRRGAVGAALLLPVSAPAGWAAASSVPDSDLASLRLLLGAELLAADLHARALASGKLSPAAAAVVRKMAADEQAHYTGVAQLLSAAGETPATADDIDFTYPKGSFASAKAILALARRIESLLLGAYLGAVEQLQTPELRLPVAQIAANEAQHLGAVAALGGRSVIGRAFAPSLQIAAASAALDRFES